LNEEKLNLLDEIKKEFACGEKDVNAYSPLALAYIGDDVYDVIIRTIVVEKANRPAHELHKETVKYVKASAQAAIMDRLLEGEESGECFLSQQEIDIYKRGRNAKSYTMAKNASMTDYRKATGFEALIGYLYLSGKQSRVLEIVKYGIS
jgi:ribonuclease-3 family protein